MKTLIGSLIVAGALAAHAEAAGEPGRHTASQAAEHIGQTGAVCGVVADTRYLAESARKPTAPFLRS
jgi:hypothetical protein